MDRRDSCSISVGPIARPTRESEMDARKGDTVAYSIHQCCHNLSCHWCAGRGWYYRLEEPFELSADPPDYDKPKETTP